MWPIGSYAELICFCDDERFPVIVSHHRPDDPCHQLFPLDPLRLKLHVRYTLAEVRHNGLPRVPPAFWFFAVQFANMLATAPD